MGILICIPWIAAVVSIVVWMTLRETLPFNRLPTGKIRTLLESIAFFIPACLTGWLSALLAYFELEANGRTLSILWIVGILISFVILGFITIAMGVKEFPKGAGLHDLIALGLGFLAGLLYGTYSILVQQWRPPQVLYTLWDRATLIIVLAILAIIALAVILVVVWNIRKSPTNRRTEQVVESKDNSTHEQDLELEKGPLDYESGQEDSGEGLT